MKIRLLSSLIALGFAGLAQNNVEVIDTATYQPAAWHYAYLVPASGSHYVTFHVKNKGTSLLRSRIKKTVVQTTGSHLTYFNYGSLMYAPSMQYSQQEPIAGGDSLPDINGRVGLEIGFDPNSVVGTSVVRYTVYDSLNHADSANITITYNATTTAVKQSGKPFLSAAWPNPAQEEIQFRYQIPAAQASILVVNALGTEVKRITLFGASDRASLHVSDLEEGIYFYSLLVDGKATLTRKLVIAR